MTKPFTPKRKALNKLYGGKLPANAEEAKLMEQLETEASAPTRRHTARQVAALATVLNIRIAPLLASPKIYGPYLPPALMKRRRALLKLADEISDLGSV